MADGGLQLSVRVFNTNTGSTILETIQVDAEGHFRDDGSYSIPGIQSTGSPIKLTFENPRGSMTGTLFPTGHLQETLSIPALPLSTGDVLPAFTVQATLIDGANPFVFVDAATMPELYHQVGPESSVAVGIVEAIRRRAAVCAGLAGTAAAPQVVEGTPKIALLSIPDVATLPTQALRMCGTDAQPDIHAVAYSMGRVHPSLQLTGAVTLGIALSVPGTVAAVLAERRNIKGMWSPPDTPPKECAEEDLSSTQDATGLTNFETERDWLISHLGGVMDVQVTTTKDNQVQAVTVFRTARRLFEGNVLVNL